jgi:hypothetical protein
LRVADRLRGRRSSAATCFVYRAHTGDGVTRAIDTTHRHPPSALRSEFGLHTEPRLHALLSTENALDTSARFTWYSAPVFAASALALASCGGGDGTPSAAQSCTALATQALPVTRITKADLVAGGTERAPGVSSGPFLPEHCVVQGSINERTGIDERPYAIGFELRLPTEWNGRFLFQGGGGNDGVVAPAVGRNTGASGAQDNALLRGFAVATTDAGHQGANALFGLDPLARIDQAYNAYDQVTQRVRTLMSARYGRVPDRSYFIGCSGGGNQAMVVAQRFPQYFDGVIAGAPSMRVAKGASISVAWVHQQFTAIAPRDSAGNPIVSQSFSNADLQLVADGIKTTCDASDNATDGLVSNPAACSFDPAVLQCTGAKTASCLSASQVTALKSAFAGPRNSAGAPLYTSWPWDPGIADPGWRAWTLGSSTTATPNSIFALLMEPTIGYEFVTPPDPSLRILNFNFDTDPSRMDAFDSIYGAWRDTTMAGFRQRGGKMILHHGMADAIFSANESAQWYRDLAANNGGLSTTQTFARLFQVPGMTHCSGGPSTDAFDGLTAIVDWVEKGQAPERIIASGTAALPGVTRPLCPYPRYARYNGSGAINDAANFTCQ